MKFYKSGSDVLPASIEATALNAKRQKGDVRHLDGTLNADITIRHLQSKHIPEAWAEQDRLFMSQVPC